MGLAMARAVRFYQEQGRSPVEVVFSQRLTATQLEYKLQGWTSPSLSGQVQDMQSRDVHGRATLGCIRMHAYQIVIGTFDVPLLLHHATHWQPASKSTYPIPYPVLLTITCSEERRTSVGIIDSLHLFSNQLIRLRLSNAWGGVLCSTFEATPLQSWLIVAMPSKPVATTKALWGSLYLIQPGRLPVPMRLLRQLTACRGRTRKLLGLVLIPWLIPPTMAQSWLWNLWAAPKISTVPIFAPKGTRLP